MSDITSFCEFSVAIAKKYGIELAIMHGHFKKIYYLSSIMDEHVARYPTVESCCAMLDFWDEETIRRLISELYLNKLI